MTAWAFASRLHARLGRTDGSVDLLITGCEVSLWLGEQFAADVHHAFPRLKVVTISANKLLGQLGQQFPVPQAGSALHAARARLKPMTLTLTSLSPSPFTTPFPLSPPPFSSPPPSPFTPTFTFTFTLTFTLSSPSPSPSRHPHLQNKTKPGRFPLPRRKPFFPQERRAAADALGRHLRDPRVRQHAQGYTYCGYTYFGYTYCGYTYYGYAYYVRCANMLKAFTSDLFAVTSEWDTQVARVVREGLPGDRRKQNISFMSHVFVTFAGPRLAEPCSVSAVAMHQLLTQARHPPAAAAPPTPHVAPSARVISA